jgi:type IV fimbrial biogenesis protein FimT
MDTRKTRNAAWLSLTVDPTDPASAAGFTLLELLITMAVAVILLTIAIPSFRYVTNANRISAEVNGLVGDLQFARAEAVKEGRYVSVCASSDKQTCSGSTAWESGWIVFVNASNSSAVTTGVAESPVLRVQSAFSSTDTFNSTTATTPLWVITFNRDGYAVGVPPASQIELHDSTNTSAWTRCASIAPGGQVTTEQFNANNASNGATCS